VAVLNTADDAGVLNDLLAIYCLPADAFEGKTTFLEKLAVLGTSSEFADSALKFAREIHFQPFAPETNTEKYALADVLRKWNPSSTTYVPENEILRRLVAVENASSSTANMQSTIDGLLAQKDADKSTIANLTAKLVQQDAELEQQDAKLEQQNATFLAALSAIEKKIEKKIEDQCGSKRHQRSTCGNNNTNNNNNNSGGGGGKNGGATTAQGDGGAGNDNNDAATNPEDSPPSTLSSSMTPVIVGIVIGALAVIGIGIGIYCCCFPRNKTPAAASRRRAPSRSAATRNQRQPHRASTGSTSNAGKRQKGNLKAAYGEVAATYNNPGYNEATYSEIEDAVTAAAGHSEAGFYTPPSVEQSELYDRGDVPGIYTGTANGDAAYAAPSPAQVDLYDRGEVPGLYDGAGNDDDDLDV
jgi:hypothetical protein